MSVFKLKSTIRITCPKYMGEYVEQELIYHKYKPIDTSFYGVEIEGTLKDCMYLNLWLRTAHKVLFLLDEFDAENPDELYEAAKIIPWEDYIPTNGYICIESAVRNDTIRDSRFANLKLKDAIVDRIMAKRNIRPYSGSEKNRTVIYLSWKENEVKLYLDTSGEPLSHHGYRKVSGKAPLQESLAAALVIASGYNGEGHFINPMCGSGTLAIEAALMALNIAPAIQRQNFGFMHLLGFDKTKWYEVKKEAIGQRLHELEGRIIATDKHPEAIKATIINAKEAGVAQYIDIEQAYFEKTNIPDGEGIVMLNPEYGLRMGEEDQLISVYKNIGDFFKKQCIGKTGFVFTGNKVLSKSIGLKPSRKFEFMNGNVECRLMKYDIFEGSKKINED